MKIKMFCERTVLAAAAAVVVDLSLIFVDGASSFDGDDDE
jgi:hypothetical protein